MVLFNTFTFKNIQFLYLQHLRVGIWVYGLKYIGEKSASLTSVHTPESFFDLYFTFYMKIKLFMRFILLETASQNIIDKLCSNKCTEFIKKNYMIKASKTCPVNNVICKICYLNLERK